MFAGVTSTSGNTLTGKLRKRTVYHVHNSLGMFDVAMSNVLI